MIFACFHARFPLKSRHGIRNKSAARLLCWLSAAMAGLMTLSCGSGHAILQVSAPPSAVAGTPFTVTVTALYNGKPDTVISSPIHFTSSDSAAILPGDYYFNTTDAGSHTFTNGVTLMTPGSQSVTATDVFGTPITGTANIMVSAAPTP